MRHDLPVHDDLDDLLDPGPDHLKASALLVLAASSRDPDLARFGGSSHLGESFILWQRGQRPVLGYLVDMERGEAAKSGLDLIVPDSESLAELRRRGAPGSEVWTNALERALEPRGLSGKTLALAGHLGAGLVHSVTKRLIAQGFGFADGHGIVRRLRKRKSDSEIAAIRAAAAATCEAFRRTAAILATAGEAPLTAGDLRTEISTTLAEHGLDQPEGNIVSVGADAGVPHTRGANDRRLSPGESIIVDLYPRARLFADCTRTFCVGEAPEAVARAHELCRQVLAGAIEGSRPGVAGALLQDSACEEFEAAGYATIRSEAGTRTGYVHGLGHGVGYELHELPSFREAGCDDGVLEVGDVFTLEPGLYDPEAGYGVRLEDLLVMTPGGVENLTPLPYDLDPTNWGS